MRALLPPLWPLLWPLLTLSWIACWRYRSRRSSRCLFLLTASASACFISCNFRFLSCWILDFFTCFRQHGPTFTQRTAGLPYSRKASKSRGIPASEKDSFELSVLRLFLKPPASHLTGTPEFYLTLQTQSSRTEMVLFLGYCIYSHNRVTCLFIPNSIELINQCLNMAFMWFHNHCTFLFKQWLLAFLQELRLAGKW